MSDVHQNLIGKCFGKVKIEKPLAAGGYGLSFLGFDYEVEKKRVVKVSLKPIVQANGDDNDVELFRREGIILARLKHPQIVSVVDQGEEFGYRYIVIEFIEGFDFARVIATLKKKQEDLKCEWGDLLDPVTALAIINSALIPLSYAHKVKIVIPGEEAVDGLAHRDISSGNLMLGHGAEHEGCVHLIDFGTAKTNINITKTVNIGVVGNVRYMSPMRLFKKGKKEEKGKYWHTFKQTQNDVHSMGCFFWELLTGTTHIEIFDNEDLMAPLSQIQNPNTYKELYNASKRYGKEIQDIIRKSIVLPNVKSDKNPYQYKDAEEMLKDVEEAYNKYSGNAPLGKVLAHFAGEIKEPENLTAEAGEKASRISNYSRSKRVKSVYVSNERKKFVFAVPVVLLIAVIGVFVFMLIKNKQPEEEGWGSAPAPTLSKSITKDKTEPINEGLPEKEMLRDDSLIPLETKEEAQEVEKQPTEAIQEKSTPKPLKNEAVKPVTVPKIEEIKEEPIRKQVPKKEVVSKEAPVENSLQWEFNRLQRMIKLKQDDEAYQLVSNLLKESDDAALFYTKAALLKKRNPKSNRLAGLIKNASEKQTVLMSKEVIEEGLKYMK